VLSHGQLAMSSIEFFYLAMQSALRIAAFSPTPMTPTPTHHRLDCVMRDWDNLGSGVRPNMSLTWGANCWQQLQHSVCNPQQMSHASVPQQMSHGAENNHTHLVGHSHTSHGSFNTTSEDGDAPWSKTHTLLKSIHHKNCS